MSMSRLMLDAIFGLKQQGEKIAVLTAYDASFANIFDAAGIDVLLVGDSLGMVIQGHETTLPVSVDDMVYHCTNVTRGSRHAYLVVDMSYQSYTTPQVAVETATRLVNEAGAQMVKLEGGRQQLDVIKALVDKGIPVCGHLGLLPQSIKQLGGYKVQGREKESATCILEDAKLLETAGVQMLVLECIPASLGKQISAALRIPVIGIGAGVDCDGQVLVSYDILGLTRGKQPRFVHNFLADQPGIEDAVRAYVAAVKDGSYPAAEHTYN